MVGIFFIATSWGRKNGGINSINYSLIRNVTKNIDITKWKVYCILTDENLDADTISNVQEEDNVMLISTKTPRSRAIKEQINENKFEQLFFIGHDIITGGFANEARNIYDNSTSIVFHHMYYQSYYYTREFNAKKITEKEDAQKNIIPDADVVIPVGPLLNRSAKDLCIDARKENKQIHEIIPGMEDIAPIKEIHNNHTIILFGRLEERNNCVKQIILAIDAIALYLKEKNKNYVIKCYGYSEDSEKNQRQVLEQAYNQAGKSINIRANAYIENEEKLHKEISSASLCIMPSFAEGFGLTAYEAMAAGVPVIISKNTGLYEFLTKRPESLEYLFQSIEVQGNPTDPEKPYTEEDLINLKKNIDNVFDDYQNSKDKALLLRSKLIDLHYTWDYTAREFIKIIHSKINTTSKQCVETTDIQTPTISIDDKSEKKRLNLSEYISKILVPEYCGKFCDPQKVVFKIIKYSNNRKRRFTVFSSDENFYEDNLRLKTRTINDGTVGVLNETFNYYDCHDLKRFPIIVSNYTNDECYCITENNTIKLRNSSIGIPDHHLLSIIAVPLIYEGNIVGAITLDMHDEEFIKSFSEENKEKNSKLHSCLKLLANDLISNFYYEIKDDINFSEVNKMITRREIVSFKGKCPLKCKHCFACEIVDEDEKEDEIQDVVDSLTGKRFDVVYVSHYKENFYNPQKGIELCEEIYKKYKCDICVTTRCILTSDLLLRVNELNDNMRENGNKLTFCISIPAYDSYNLFENDIIVPTPQQRIDFAGQLKNSGVTTIVTIRPMFPSLIVPNSEVCKIVDNCAGKVDAILTGGLYVSDNIIERLNISEDNLPYLENTDSEYLIGVEKKFKAVNVNAEIDTLRDYCRKRDIPFFKHSMDALNYFK